MRILLTGISGMLGSDLWPVLEKAGHELTGIDITKPSFVSDKQFKEADITDQQKTYQVVSRCNPDIVIHLAAYTDVDGSEKNPEVAYRVNGLGTRNLLLGAQRFDTAFLYISTDYIFGNDEKKSYTEYDTPHSIMHYARSKEMGEKFVQQLTAKFYIVRIAWLFGKNKKNYIQQIADSIKNGKPYRAASDMVGSPTFTRDVAQAIAFLIERGTYGIYHVTNEGYASRYDVAMEIAQVLKKEPTTIQKVTLDELKLPAKRPKSSILENYMWKLNGYPPLRHWKEAVRELVKELT